MRKIIFDFGAAVRSEWPWQGEDMKIQALNGNDIDVRHFALSALAGAAQECAAGLVSAHAKLGSNLSRVDVVGFDPIAFDRKP
jgi:hypothetical protein